MSNVKKQKLDPGNPDLGLIFNSAVRYALGRRTYIVDAVIGFITPLIEHIDDRTLYVLDQDITEAQLDGNLGDEHIDKPEWVNFHRLVVQEELRRGKEPYKSWRA